MSTLNKSYCDLIYTNDGCDNHLLVARCEKITNDFTMLFGNWLFKNSTHPKLFMVLPNKELIRLPMKDILLIFKKETGL